MPAVRALAVAFFISIVTASVCCAAPPGLNLSWSDCGSAGQATRVFACDTDLGTHTLVGSYALPVALDSLDGNEIVIDMQSVAPTVVPWWQLKNYTSGPADACRQGAGGVPAAVSMGFDFTGSPPTCFDFWAGRALGGFGFLRPAAGSLNRQRILGVSAVALEQAGPLAANTETYAFILTINNTRTTGAGACAGCSNEAQLVFTSFRATVNPGSVMNDVLIDNPATRNYVTWNPAVVATRNVTWGAIKSMYR